MAQKITNWLLIALVFSLGFGQLLRFDLLGVPLYLHDIILGAVLFLITLQGYTLKVKILPSLKIFLLGLSLGWIFAFTQYSISDLLVPALFTIRLLAYLTLHLAIQNSKLKIQKSFFAFAGLITLFIGLAQYFFLPDMRIFQYLGWDDHLSRLTLPHFDPTFTAVMIGLYALSWIPASTPHDLGIYLFSCIAILLTYSRSVWLSLVLTLLAFVKNKKILISVLSLVILATILLPKKFGEGTNLLRTYSISSRISSDFSYIQKYQWNLLIGRGMNTLILDGTSADTHNHASGPNNSYLYLLTTTGILGLVGWGMFMTSLYKKSTHKPMLIFFLIASLFNNVMFYSFALIWVLLIESNIVT